MRTLLSLCIAIVLLSQVIISCTTESKKEYWDFEIDNSTPSRESKVTGIMKLNTQNGSTQGELVSIGWGTMELKNITTNKNEFSGNLEFREQEFSFKGIISGENFEGSIYNDKSEFPFTANKVPSSAIAQSTEEIVYTVPSEDLPDYEKNIDHAGIIDGFDGDGYTRGKRIYNNNCINCHGNPDVEGSIPLARKFWEQPMHAGNDPYSIYQVITRGYKTMPPQPTLTPREKYDVSLYINEEYVKNYDESNYFKVNESYLSSLPDGNEKGPDVQPYHPWSDVDYGNFFINTYELADEETGIPRFHSPGPRPYADEDYLKNNFAYKGIAVRVDKGDGGVSAGKAWMMFDHDLMRVAGGWTGEGFIDWNGILLNDRHETYPRTIGKVHFETPVGPGWANPQTGKYDDPRFTARDGRQFGPLPKKWADYKGLYYYEDKVIISYKVGDASVLELPGLIDINNQTIFTRTINISASSLPLQMRLAKADTQVKIQGEDVSLKEENGFVVLDIPKGKSTKFKVFLTSKDVRDLDNIVKKGESVEDLTKYTKGGPTHYDQELTTTIMPGMQEGPLVIDVLEPPFDNPWKSRMKLSGIDFFDDPDKAIVCTVGGDVWTITGLINGGGTLKWKRIASGLFQPLGIKIVEGETFITCRDQIVRLQDLNGNGETDFYESFNHDHQVTDHFHEFAMGLQVDKDNNLYYAKSGRHARESLIPQHGTLLKVSSDGSNTEIIATGFRAANGVCINPDGSFIVTDQQGYWNPMNRINWVTGKGNFYGNMWGYNPPKDTSRAAMEPPLTWVDMDFDRSPSELLWVESEQWGPLNGSLLSLSYGYGKIQLVLPEKVKGQMQGGVIDLPGVKFMTGVMRGRFNPKDGYLYACGISAWGTNQMMKGGGLYRLRYNDKALSTPIELNVLKNGLKLTFASSLDAKTITDLANYEVKTWDLVRSSNYGSKRYNTQTLPISDVKLGTDGKSVILTVPNIKPVDVMTIDYKIQNSEGVELKGIVQNTIHNLGTK